MELYVASDGSKSFSTLQDALNYLQTHNDSDNCTIYMSPGIYREKIHITSSHVKILGHTAADTSIIWSDYALMTDPSGEEIGTFRTQTVMIEADHVAIENLSIINDAGPGWKVAQGIALYADGTDLAVRNCRLIGHQDTLFTGPRPFRNQQNSDERHNIQYYENCYIEGDVDFVFGCAEAHFEKCEFYSVFSQCPAGEVDHTQKPEELIEGIYGYVTAASTPQNQCSGYTMRNCRFTGDCPPGTVYLGRPWGRYSRVTLYHCYLGEHIHPEGWHDWHIKWHEDARKDPKYEEIDCYGPGSDPDDRPEWVKISHN